MSQSEEQLALSVSDIEASKVILSEKKTKKWQWKEDGELKSRTQTYAEVYYGEEGRKLCFTLSDVKTINGIQTMTKFNSGFMSINLTPEQSQEVRNKLDNVLFKLAYENRVEMMKKGGKISHPSEMRLMFQGFVKEGEEKKDKPGEFWGDQVTAKVPTKRRKQQVIVDDNLCVVEDLGGKPYSWTALDRKGLKEIAIEVDRMIFDKDITVRGSYRLIVPNEVSRPKIVTKRKLQLRNEEPGVSSGPLKKTKTELRERAVGEEGGRAPEAGGETQI
jgi:hypothetical protein